MKFVSILFLTNIVFVLPEDQNGRIIGGEPTEKGQYPWMAIVRSSSSGRICHGSLIQPNWILTSANCADLPGYSYNITVGDYDQSREEGTEQTRSNVLRLVMHPDYITQDETSDSNNNIALFQVDPPFEINDFVQKLPLAPVGFKLTDNVAFAGWGLMDHLSPLYPDILQTVTVPIVPDDLCFQYYNENPEGIKVPLNLRTIFCAGEEGRGMCVDDYGGPAMCEVDDELVLCGVISFQSMGCGYEEWPAVVTDVLQYLDWIEASLLPEPMDNSTWIDQDGICGGVILGSSGKLSYIASSPSIDLRQTCTWTIRTNDQSKVRVNILNLNISEVDSLIISAVDPWTGLVVSNEIIQNNSSGLTLDLMGPLLLITYTTQGSTDEGQGFSLEFYGSGYSYSSRRRFNHYHFGNDSGTFKYPIEGSTYQNSETATFVFNFPQTSGNVSILRSFIEGWEDKCNGDYLYINQFDTIGGLTLTNEICGDKTEPIVYPVVDGTLVLVFQTDDENVERGFELEWTFI